ncbi:MAG TPA: hypothetical protein VLY21_04240 [Nitrososphaerales archaeon]|nr:hypothetical protein [Nitrososphaerales archaeon]
MVVALRPEETARLRSYIAEHGDDLGFTRFFWRGCEPLESDVIQYRRFVGTLRMLQSGRTAAEVSRELGVNANSVSNWKNLIQMPKLGHFLKALLILGPPSSNRVWLTLEQSHGHAIPLGRFIEVPTRVTSWRDVDPVLTQTMPLQRETPEFTKPYLFGFLLGIMIGDAHKPKQGRGHRHIDLTLSMKYETNLKIGELTCRCARDLGLRMERAKDKPKQPHKPYGFYDWISQSSPLIDWMFLVAIGLADGQHTTYDTVQMDWALNSPEDFRTGLIQGIAESDGSVSIASQTVEFWVIPDWDFVIKLLATFGLRGFRNREAVSLVKSQAIGSFKVPVFSSYLQTVRYQRLRLMATTRKLTRRDRISDEVQTEIKRLANDGLSVPRILEEIAKSHSVLLSFEAVQRWARRLRSEDSRDQDGPDITKGIEG